MTISLDRIETDAGAMERLFLVEAISPAQSRLYIVAENLAAMRLMRQVIENRLRSPGEYGAPGARTRIDIIKARGQFAGFRNYPTIVGDPAVNLPEILRLANASSDPRHPAYEQFVRDAITAATEVVSPIAAYSDVTGWRTARSGSPGPRFQMVVTLSGNTFYRTMPAIRPPEQRRR